MIEDSYGNRVLNLVLAWGYLAKLFGNARVVRYLGQNHSDSFSRATENDGQRKFGILRCFGILPTRVSRARIAQLASDLASWRGSKNAQPAVNDATWREGGGPGGVGSAGEERPGREQTTRSAARATVADTKAPGKLNGWLLMPTIPAVR
jgi:hypothetical protein